MKIYKLDGLRLSDRNGTYGGNSGDKEGVLMDDEYSACSNITAYSLDGNTNALFRDILHLDIPELKKSIRKNVPLIKKHLPEIFKMIEEIPLTTGSYKIISKERKAVYKKEMELRMSELLIPAYNKTIMEQSVSKDLYSSPFQSKKQKDPDGNFGR